VGDYISQ